MRRTRFVSGALMTLAACAVAILASATGDAQVVHPRPSPAATSAPPALLKQYCIGCHDQKRRTAGLAFDTMDLSNVSRDADVWEKVLVRLRAGAMPPTGMPRPDQHTTDAFVAWLEGGLDRAATAHPYVGRTDALHRLNRAEYKNVIRDLLALDVDVASLLPPDDADARGLDNIASLLSVPPALLERYLSAAHAISRRALGLPPPAPVTATYKVPEFTDQDEQVSDDLPAGSRGGTVVTHDFPVDGEYLIKVRLHRTLYEYVAGIYDAERIQVRLDGELVKEFRVGGEGHGTPPPSGFSGDLPAGPEWEQYATGADAHLEIRIPVREGPRTVGVSFVEHLSEPEHIIEQSTVYSEGLRDETRPQSVASVEISGPYRVSPRTAETPSRRKILVCHPARVSDEEPCARSILSAIARRAYRRPATSRELQTLLGFFASGRRDGGFDTGLQFALERVLADPNFLFRVERDPKAVGPRAAYRVSGLELASRLSFFLWSSMPDDELQRLALQGTLTRPEVLDRQVRRMIADPRANALVENFVGQWLLLRNIRNVSPDPDLFPDFDESLRTSMLRETEIFVTSQFRADRSVVDLLSAKDTFVNERLARHYGIPGVYGSHFRRVTFGPDDVRGGLLGQGSLLMVTSYPNRTSPVLRGKWVLGSLLGTPPPPPPPNVPGLKDRGENGQPATVRARLEAHRKNPVCAACHAPMDPLGFALENFDAVGGWRTADAGTPVDATGVLPGGATIQGPNGLRQALLDRRELFVRALTEKLLSYALGRGLQPSDMPTVRTIVRDSAAHDYRWSSIVAGIARSAPFLMRSPSPSRLPS